MKHLVLFCLFLCFVGTANSQTKPGLGRSMSNLAPRQATGKLRNSPQGGPVINAAQYSSIQAAVDSLASTGGQIWIPCGTYVGNITITSSNLWLHGAGWQCVILEPSSDGDMLVLDATKAGANGINFDRVDGLMLSNLNRWTGSGLVLKGGNNQPNDWHTFSSLVIAGFYNGIDIRGRDIWSTFSQIFVADSEDNGLRVDNPSAAVNHDVWRDGRISTSANYGVYWNGHQSFSILFDHENIEYNGASGTLRDCAGLYMTGTGTVDIQNSYFEGNCQTSPDSMGADIHLTGTYNQAVNVTGTLIWSTTDYGILNDSVQTTGHYFGNYIANKSAFPIEIASTHPLSVIDVGCNFENGGSNKYVADSNGSDHVIDSCAGKRNLISINSVTNNTISVANTSYAEILEGPYTIKSMTGGYTGQIVTLEAKSGALTIAHIQGSGAVNTFSLPNNSTLRIPAAGSASFVLATDQTWHLLAGTYVTTSSAPAAGQLACIKSAGPPVLLGTCTAVNGAACTSCN